MESHFVSWTLPLLGTFLRGPNFKVDQNKQNLKPLWRRKWALAVKEQSFASHLSHWQVKLGICRVYNFNRMSPVYFRCYETMTQKGNTVLPSECCFTVFAHPSGNQTGKLRLFTPQTHSSLQFHEQIAQLQTSTTSQHQVRNEIATQLQYFFVESIILVKVWLKNIVTTCIKHNLKFRCHQGVLLLCTRMGLNVQRSSS